MLNFLRNIRHNQLNEQKIGNYLIYALGEILLVVLGILIALQINNWNEGNNQRKSVKASFEALKSNLLEDVNNYEEHIAFNNIVIKDIDFAFRIMSEEELQKKPYSEIGDSILYLGIELNFIASKSAFKMMESSGKFQYIEDESVTDDIYKYYNQVEEFETIVTANNKFVQLQLEPLIFKNMEIRAIPSLKKSHIENDFRPLRKDNSKFLADNAYMENLLISRKYRLQNEINSFNNGLEKAKKLMERLEKEYLGE